MQIKNKGEKSPFKTITMYKYKTPKKTSIQIDESLFYYDGESMEEKLRRVMNNKEPIDSVAERIYTDRKDGVQPEFDIRTDKWELAAEGFNAINNDNLAQSEAKRKSLGEEAAEGMKAEAKGEVGGPEPIQGTDPK